MTKISFNLKLIALFAASMMGHAVTSDAQVRGETSTSELSSPSITLSFKQKDNCVIAKSPQKLALSLTDGTQVTLPRAWTQSISVSNAKKNTSPVASIKLESVNQMRMNLPWAVDDLGCAMTVPVLLHHKDVQIDYAGEGKPGVFDTMFSPLIKIQQAGSARAIKFYNQYDPFSIVEGDLKLIQISKSRNSVDWNEMPVTSRYTAKQKVRQAGIKPTLGAIFRTNDTPPGLIINTRTNNLIGVFERSQSKWRNGGGKLMLHFAVSENYFVMLEVDSEVSDLKSRSNVTTRKFNPMNPVDDISEIYKSLTSIFSMTGFSNFVELSEPKVEVENKFIDMRMTGGLQGVDNLISKGKCQIKLEFHSMGTGVAYEHIRAAEDWLQASPDVEKFYAVLSGFEGEVGFCALVPNLEHQAKVVNGLNQHIDSLESPRRGYWSKAIIVD